MLLKHSGCVTCCACCAVLWWPPCLQVSLVLEYCDWGSLRTALDAGAFFAGVWLGFCWFRAKAAGISVSWLRMCHTAWLLSHGRDVDENAPNIVAHGVLLCIFVVVLLQTTTPSTMPPSWTRRLTLLGPCCTYTRTRYVVALCDACTPPSLSTGSGLVARHLSACLLRTQLVYCTPG